MQSDRPHQLADPATKLLLEREFQALKLITITRFLMLGIMAPMTWLFGFSTFDRVATSLLLVVYFFVVCFCWYLINRREHHTVVGLSGVALDVIMVGLLPFIWYTSLGGNAIPVGLILKSSVTVIAILLIALNALTMRPLYPLLVAVGALMVHAALILIALGDERSIFTSNYLIAYTTPGIATGSIGINITIVSMVGAILTLLTLRARKMIIEAVQLQKQNDQLGRYFSPNLVQKLSENPALLQVSGERKELSFVFTDLQGFTSLVESNEPAVVVPILNGYLDQLMQVAFKHEGTVDKIVGDAVHVMFGAPVTQSDHAARAVSCALEMDAVAEQYRRSVASEISLGITRIGVNSGTVVVGNFGSETFFDYTACGDAINMAARLEAANKVLGTRICVSAETASRVANFKGRPVGTLWLRGKSESTPAYEPLEQENSRPPVLEAYLRAYELMRAKHAGALEAFEKLYNNRPEDPLVRFHRERLKSGQLGDDVEIG